MNACDRFAGSLLIAGLIWASPISNAGAETIIESLAKAYATNPELLSQRAALRAVDEEIPQALANWKPTIEITGETGVEQVDSNTSTATRHPKTGTLSITQPLFRGFRTLSETRRAKARVASQQANLHATEQSLLIKAVGAYMNVVRDKAVLELNQRNERRVARQLQAAKDRFQVGEITQTDVAQAEARHAGAKADLIRAQGTYVSVIANYKRIIGDAPGTLKQPTLKLELPSNSEEAISLAENINPNVIQAHYNVLSAEHNIGLIRGELFPELELEGTYTKEENTSSSVTKRDTAELMAKLTIPLYQAGDVYSRLRASKETAIQRREELDNAKRVAIEGAATSWIKLQTARAIVDSFRAEVRANKIALDGVQREALVGSRTVLDVLDAEQELLDSRVSLVRSEREELVARFELKQSVGTLTAENLQLPVTFNGEKKGK
ncbi:MAG: TolC family outer membrane protein [Rhodospirillales bacterium]|jgi:outer membrane protein|nr:TolC family outer membrane protein [Rhodospirillales bacterium]MBT5075320.1 TolC family outer membrane protein [Rhodospirillales bacterium]MBT5112868.1 TolC family outer membrane protein [Rhodospirillales bacterium]MBT5673639.1 TolC family outer membrane protein [Rhodospirillales bacterium]MBT6186297.1 TolC family outer membrane protein [Rhodospirillales bacterium]